MRIKKSNNNSYVNESGFWIRDFTQIKNRSIDINKFFDKEDMDLFIKNEKMNKRLMKATKPKEQKKVLIVSDGYALKEKQLFLDNIDNNTYVILTNNSIRYWELNHNIYLVNNPYEDCLKYMSSKIKNCLSSCRTNPNYLNKIKSNITLYQPTKNSFYSGVYDWYNVKLDDYRSSITAALHYAYLMNPERICLLCTDSCHEIKKPGMVQSFYGLYQYEQNFLSEKILDTMLFWLLDKDVDVRIHSSGHEYKNAKYIEEENILDFIGGKNE